MSKTEAIESSKKELYDPQKVFQLSSKWRLAIVKTDNEFFTNALLLTHLGYKITIVIEPNKAESILTAKELFDREHSVIFKRNTVKPRLFCA